MPIELGTIVHNRYRIEKLLGQGGFGAVYRVWDNSLGRPCALKENLETSAVAKRQFEREAKMLANLNHPNLTRVTDYFIIEGQGQYLVMDFVEGIDLQEMLDAQGGPISETQALSWIGQVCDALGYLHSQNPPIIHRDIKPPNIKINSAGQAMLVDFGIAKVFDPSQRTTLGARAVTPGYAPVEQYGQGTTDVRTDLYALGATLYHMLTGQHPPESIQRMIRETLIPAQQLNPALSPSTAAALLKAMNNDPEKRFQSAAEFKAAFFPSTPVSDARPEMVMSRQAAPAIARTVVSERPPLSSPGAAPVKVVSGVARQVPGRRRLPWMWIVGLVGLLGIAGIVVVGALVVGALGEKQAATSTPALLTGGSTPGSPTKTSELPSGGDTPEPVATNPELTLYPAFRSLDPMVYVHAMSYVDPDTLDPTLDYEDHGGQILLNVYDTLVFYKGDDGQSLVPQLATDWEMSSDEKTYTFFIREGVKFHDGSPLLAEDVAYTFQRGILQGNSDSPQWLFVEPILGVNYYNIAELVDDSGNLIDDPEALQAADPARLLKACMIVTEAIRYDNEAGTVTFQLSQPWSPFLLSLAGPWGSIQSKNWVMSNGGWDGDCATWQNYYGRPTKEINKTSLGSSAMGTGPYIFDHWTPGIEVVLVANENYWRQEPAWEGGPSGPPRIKRIVLKEVDEFVERLALLQENQADSIDVDEENWIDMIPYLGQECIKVDSSCQPSNSPEQPVELIRGFQLVSREDILFNWDISTKDNPFLGSGQLDGAGIPPDFFQDIHIRRAFNYCFNYDRYLRDLFLGEALRSVNVMLPDMIGYQSDSPYYAYDPDKCRKEFEASSWRSPDGRTLMEIGFNMVLPYDDDSYTRRLIGEIFKQELEAVNSKFSIGLSPLPNDDYWDRVWAYQVPYYITGWLEDIHDPHNWVTPYTVGPLGERQRMPDSLLEKFQEFIEQGVAVFEPSQRALIYTGFNQLYYEQAPGILLFIPYGHRYQQRWVNGWFFNPGYFGTYFYNLWKD